jgi:sugar phosphate isomerase/epimerase
VTDPIFSLKTERAPHLEKKQRPTTPSILPQLAMSQMTTFHWSMSEDIVNYQSAGIPGIGLWRRKIEDFGELPTIDFLRHAGMSVSSLSWAGCFTGFQGLSLWDALEDAHSAIELAGKVQADCVVISSGPRAGHTFNHSRNLLVDSLKFLADFAAENNVKLALKPMLPAHAKDWTFLNCIDSTLEALSLCQHPQVKMVFDLFHLRHEPNLIEHIPSIVPEIALVQFSDWKNGSSTNTEGCIPGEGDLPIDSILSRLIDSGYKGFFETQILSDKVWNSDYRPLLSKCQNHFSSLAHQQRRRETSYLIESDLSE